MIRRYSAPRHFTAGCTGRFWPRGGMKSSGLTTIPSPPRDVSSSHQATPAATSSASVTSMTRYGVASSRPSSWRQTAASVSMCQTWSRSVCVRPFRGEDVERREAQVVDRVDRPAVPASRPRRSARPGPGGSACARRSRAVSTPRSAAASSAGMTAASAVRAATPVGAYCCRISSCALADQGMSSASMSTQSVASSSQVPAASIAARTRPRTATSRSSSKNRRPVRV